MTTENHNRNRDLLLMPMEDTALSLDVSTHPRKLFTRGDVVPHDAVDVNQNFFSDNEPDDDDDDLEFSEGEDDDEELDEDKILAQATEHGRISHYPGENEHATQQQTEAQKAPRSVIAAGVESLKFLYSGVFLVFSIIVVTTAIFTKQTYSTGQKNIPPVVVFLTYWFLILWMAFMKGSYGCLIGLQPIPKAMYLATHPRTFKCTSLAHKGNNLERFIVGRQFLVISSIFLINYLTTTVPDAQVLGMSKTMNDVFLSSGLATILITTILGQLTGQVNAGKCMLDFMNNYFMLFTTYVCLALELSGLLHAVYLVQIILSMISGKPIESNESPRSLVQNLFFWGRVLMSTTILVFAFTVTLKAMLDGKTLMWSGLPSYVSVIIFFVVFGLASILEGVEIALSAAASLPEAVLAHHAIARKNCKRAFVGKKLKTFFVGRQICATTCMFIIARITTLNYTSADSHVFGVSTGLQNFFNTGLLGALMTTIVASLTFRIMASSFPVFFLSNPFVYLIIRFCLLLQKIGICSIARAFARYHKIFLGYQPDAVYLDGAERHGTEPVTRRDKDIDRLVIILKILYSLALFVFSVVLVMTGIFKHKARGTSEMQIPPVAIFFLFWSLIVWLAFLEGGQGALVGLQAVEKSLYAESHPRSHRCTSLAHRGDNLERFIVGRKFLVVAIMFFINALTVFSTSTTVFNLPKSVDEMFLATGIAVILVTIMLGKLTSHVNATSCMLDFANNYLLLISTYLSLAIEFSGLLHSVYLVQIIFSRITGKPIESNEGPRNKVRKVFFWGRVMMSLAILTFSFAATVKALLDGKTTLWSGMNPYVSVVTFFILFGVLGLLEGTQIALFAVAELPESEIQGHAIASSNLRLAFSGQNLQAFLVGRKICVTTCLFIAARFSTLNYAKYDPTVFGLPEGFRYFFNTGILGALITTIAASLTFHILASSFPILFLSNPLVHLIIRLCLLLDASGVCSAAWVFGRWNKVLANFQPDAVYLEGAERQGKAPITRRDKNVDITVTVVKYLYSMALLGFCLAVVMDAVFSKQTTISKSTNPAVAFFLFWGLLIWLGMMEGGQGCLIGLQPVDAELYRESHPVTWKCTKLAHKDDNMGRVLVGRQFLVVLVVFVVNLCIKATASAHVLNLSHDLSEVFVASGVASIFCTITISQLTAQVNAANCMLDFINTRFMLFTLYVSLAIEYSGLLHSVYLVQILFSKITGKVIETKAPPRDAAQEVFFWVRLCMSVFILTFAFVVTLTALFHNSTEMWNGVPIYVSVIFFLFLLCFMGMLQGLQVALFTVVKLPKETLDGAPIAKKNCELAFSGRNLQAFLIGRQVCVTLCMFILSDVTTVKLKHGQSNVLGVSDGMETLLFNTGLLGALITTIVGCLTWRIFASAFPVAYLSNPLIYVMLRLCLTIEASGLCSAAWLLALIHKEVAGFQLDETYIGTAEERAAAAAAKQQADVAKDNVDNLAMSDAELERAAAKSIWRDRELEEGVDDDLPVAVKVNDPEWAPERKEGASASNAHTLKNKLDDFGCDLELEEGGERS